MANAIWAALGLVALLWPSHLRGPIDGAPLDFATEAIAFAAIVFATWLRPALLKATLTRGLIAALVAFNIVIALTASMDGWCLRFTSPVPLYMSTGQVPHSWDVRADWRTPVPQCSAILRRSYATLEEFPVWFYNLPPVDQGSPATKDDRPPNVKLEMEASGYLDARGGGTLKVEAGEDVRTRVEIDGQSFDHAQAASGIQVAGGVHHVRLFGGLERSHWSLRVLWNDRDLWSSALATTTEPATLDRWLRPWAGYVPFLLIAMFLASAAASIASRAGSPLALAFTVVTSIALAAVPFLHRDAFTRLGVVALFAAVLLPVSKRVQNAFGASLLIGAPLLALFIGIGFQQIGVFTWYSSGDDWWMFQRYGYRIFMEGYWLEGGQQTFWFQPLYRWIAGSLHMIFGDSSVGELWWDGACAGIGAFFTFAIVRRVGGFRWALAAAVMTLAILLLGPAWYLFGRGLSELSSMGFIYGAALAAMRSRRGHAGSMLVTIVLCALAFYTRLNNLPMVLAVVVFAFPTRQPVFDVWKPRVWWTKASWRVLATVIGGVLLAMLLFTWRTYHYTGHFDMFYGTQASDRSVWKVTQSVATNISDIFSSLAMVMTMTDPPAADVRAVPIVGGILAALLGVIGIPRLRSLPLNASLLTLSGLTGAIVARGSAYPGRFSLHLIPGAVAVFACAVCLLLARRRSSAQPATVAISDPVT